ncbi:CarD family transcriptional regulator [Clostridium sp.]|uniref:CarD family transcriptional regulator n=1 Tax=Clostridium sp. TaxID=1506 RepID=UPI0025BA9971|nr:CarD family transcriptional regulator [Clostridium sp.]
MFKINDYVVYGSNGVCKVTDIEQVTLRNEELEYYILSPVYNEKMTIKTPVNNQRILMRDLMTKAEIVNLLKEISKNETVDIEDSRRRVEEYKAIIKRGNAEELIKVINSIKLEKDEKNSIGKKLNKTDEDIMISASKQLYQEMAIVLEIDVDEVQDYIANNI